MSHAALLRIDVEATDGPGGNYGIPSNPFVVGVTGDDEIWAFGVRNPRRIALDTSTDDLSQDATQSLAASYVASRRTLVASLGCFVLVAIKTFSSGTKSPRCVSWFRSPICPNC